MNPRWQSELCPKGRCLIFVVKNDDLSICRAIQQPWVDQFTLQS